MTCAPLFFLIYFFNCLFFSGGKHDVKSTHDLSDFIFPCQNVFLPGRQCWSIQSSGDTVFAGVSRFASVLLTPAAAPAWRLLPGHPLASREGLLDSVLCRGLLHLLLEPFLLVLV